MLRNLFHLFHFRQRHKRLIYVYPRPGNSTKNQAELDDLPSSNPIIGLRQAGLEDSQITEELLERWGRLTRRERQVGVLLLKDFKYNQIADLLVISIETVKTHTHRIRVKFEVHSARELRHAILTSSILRVRTLEMSAQKDDEENDCETKGS